MAVVESLSDTAGATVLQTDPPAAMRGRVLGVWRSASTAWGLAGPPLLGLMMELMGVRAALVVGGAVVLITIAAGALRAPLQAGWGAMTVSASGWVGTQRTITSTSPTTSSADVSMNG
jgi:hypothetical protein